MLTMCGPVEPVIEKVHSNKTKVPCPRIIPWQSYQMKIVVKKHIKSKFCTQHNYPAIIKNIN